MCNNSSLLQYILGRVPPAVPSFLASITAIVSSTSCNFEHMRTIISCKFLVNAIFRDFHCDF